MEVIYIDKETKEMLDEIKEKVEKALNRKISYGKVVKLLAITWLGK